MPDAESLAEHGRGMALMEMVMDSVQYLSDNGNTVVRMRKNRPAAAPVPAAADHPSPNSGD
jgi:anti-sigma regulatory factor (Ser/Thr protein kinase)